MHRANANRGDKRASRRRPMVVRARLTWKDHHGTTRMANVLTRNISDEAVYVEWRQPSAIPLYRLVVFQVVPEARREVDLPDALRNGKVLSVVFRAGGRRLNTGTPEGYALRLLIDPMRKGAERITELPALISETAIA